MALFLSPWIIGFSVFILYPMIASLYYSFTNYDLLEDPTWVGWQNYRFMFTKDPQFWIAMRNTLWIIAVGVPLQILTALTLGWLLTRPKRGSRFYRTALFLPTMVPPVAAALGFVFLFNPSTGPINQGLKAMGVHDPPLWFYSPYWSKWGLVFLGLWGVGQTMMIFLAGLLDVPQQLYEAAEIEGAGAWQRFRHVTLPMISPVIFFSVVIGVIAGFQYFTQAYVASFAVSGMPTGSASSNIGGPEESTLFYSLHLYIKGFAHFQMGYASAMAWILFLIIMACTILLIRSSRRWVHYQGGFR
ncbi:MAG TPA: sugar ABC transporter permease [Actinomycetota bacterium]|nr:sugar ABC transporter permease [Actinomycetota bacterium]